MAVQKGSVGTGILFFLPQEQGRREVCSLSVVVFKGGMQLFLLFLPPLQCMGCWEVSSSHFFSQVCGGVVIMGTGNYQEEVCRKNKSNGMKQGPGWWDTLNNWGKYPVGGGTGNVSSGTGAWGTWWYRWGNVPSSQHTMSPNPGGTERGWGGHGCR